MMTRELFDPERLRKRWAPAEPVEIRAVHPKLAEVHAPVDTLAQARELLLGLRVHARRDLPEHQEVLAPFFDEAERALDALVESQKPAQIIELPQAGEKGEAQADEPAQPPQPAQTAERVIEILWRLEDLLEAYYFLTTRP